MNTFPMTLRKYYQTVVKFHAAYRYFGYLKGKCVTAVGGDDNNDDKYHKRTHLDSRQT